MAGAEEEQKRRASPAKAVIPAEAGIQSHKRYPAWPWIPAFAGMTRVALDIRVYMGFGAGPGMRHRALIGGAHILRIAPQRARLIVVGARLPCGLALGEQCFVDEQVDRPSLGVDADAVAILDQSD